jgi:hypothetical protein
VNQTASREALTPARAGRGSAAGKALTVVAIALVVAVIAAIVTILGGWVGGFLFLLYQAVFLLLLLVRRPRSGNRLLFPRWRAAKVVMLFLLALAFAVALIALYLAAIGGTASPPPTDRIQ